MSLSRYRAAPPRAITYPGIARLRNFADKRKKSPFRFPNKWVPEGAFYVRPTGMAYQKKPKRQIRIEGDSAFVPLTKGKETVIDAANVHLFEKWNWHVHFNKRDNKYYARRTTRIKGVKINIHAHHVVVGNVPADYIPHHVDGDGLNNIRSNLEVVTSIRNSHLAGKKTAVGRRQIVHKKNAAGRLGAVRYIKRSDSWSVQIVFGYHFTKDIAEKINNWAEDAVRAYIVSHGPPPQE